MRILVGMPDKHSRGGPIACEPPFVEELRKQELTIDEELYVHAGEPEQITLPNRIMRVLRTALRFRQKLKAARFDIVHLNTSFDLKAVLRDVVTLFFLRAFDVKVFLKFHGSDAALLQTKNFVLKLSSKALLQRADGIGVLSSEEKENFVRAGVNERKVFIVKNVVQTPMLPDARQRRAFADEMKIDANVPVLLFIARFIPAKGLLDVIEACRLLRDRNHSFVLFCVGDGAALPEAKAKVEKENLQQNVRFCGFIPEAATAAFYANCTMLLFPTYHYEGFPMVIFNAIAAGTPVITTRIRAAADYLNEPDNCLWTKPRNPEMLAEKIVYLLQHNEEREQMARNNKEKAQQFTARAVTPEYVEIYRQLIEGETRGQRSNSSGSAMFTA